MSVNVNFNARYGFVTKQYTNKEGVKVTYKAYLCQANCMWAEIYFYKDEENEEIAQLDGFFMDIKHMERVLADGWYTKNKESFTFYYDVLNKETEKAAIMLAKKGVDVRFKKCPKKYLPKK